MDSSERNIYLSVVIDERLKMKSSKIHRVLNLDILSRKQASQEFLNIDIHVFACVLFFVLFFLQGILYILKSLFFIIAIRAH